MSEWRHDEYCKCGGVLGRWDLEYPFVMQNVMHSPVGCLRRNLELWQLKALYYDLTGFRLGSEIDSIEVVFQAVMYRLEQDPATKDAVHRHQLPRSHSLPVEFPRNQPGSMVGRGVGRVPVILPPSNLPIKPPWEV